MDKPSPESSAGAKVEAALSEDQLHAIARAIGDPRRLDLLRAIAAHQPGISCFDLRAGCSISPATLSHHVAELEAAGLVTSSKRGKFVDLSFRRDVWRAYLAELKKL